MNYKILVPQRRVLVQRLEQLTGQRSVYTRLPRCAYKVGPFTLAKDGYLEAEETQHTLPILELLVQEKLIKGPAPSAVPATPNQAASPTPSAQAISLPTVTEWFDDPRCDYIRNPSNASTRKTHLQMFLKNVSPIMGKLRLDQVTGTDVEKVYRLMEKRGYAANTINGVYEMMAMIFNAAVRAGLLKKSPTVGHRYPTGRLIQGYHPDKSRGKRHEAE